MNFSEHPPEPGCQARLDVLILARDEADVLPGTLAALMNQIGPQDRLTVVADHCRDGTADAARQMNAFVFQRQSGPVGKGWALRWWLDQTQGVSKPDDRVVILDADSLVRNGFVEVMRREISQGSPVVQAILEETSPGPAGAVKLASLSEQLDQRVYDRIRSRLGWPVRLRGTGMGFRRSVLESAACELETTVEDAELTLLLGAAGIPIRLLWSARLVDAKPASDQAAVRQRARWLKGQMDLVRRHPLLLLGLLGRGPRGWSLLSSVLAKPRSLTVPLRLVACLGLLWADAFLGISGRIGAVALALSVIFDGAALAVAVVLSPHPLESLASLLRLPGFIWVWMRSLLLAARSRDRWLRTRPRTSDSGMTSPGPAAT